MALHLVYSEAAKGEYHFTDNPIGYSIAVVKGEPVCFNVAVPDLGTYQGDTNRDKVVGQVEDADQITYVYNKTTNRFNEAAINKLAEDNPHFIKDGLDDTISIIRRILDDAESNIRNARTIGQTPKQP